MDRLTIIVTLVTINAALSRALREDVRLFPSLKAPWRDLVLGVATLLIAPALDTVMQGTPIVTALWTAGAAALPNLIKLLVSIFATPQSAGQVVAQAQANRLAKLPPMACLLICLAAIALFASGCAGRFDEAKAAGAPYRAQMAATAAPTTPNGMSCPDLDRGRLYWHGFGTFFGSVGGVTGVGALATPQDDRKTQLAFGVATVLAVGAAVGSEAIAQGAGNEWAKYCSAP